MSNCRVWEPFGSSESALLWVSLWGVAPRLVELPHHSHREHHYLCGVVGGQGSYPCPG